MDLSKQMRVIRSDDLDSALRKIADEAAEYGRKAERAAIDKGETALRLENKPGSIDETVAELRTALEDEVQIAHPIDSDAVIDVREQDREIAKRALVHIKLPTLRQIAKDLDVAPSGNLEAVTDRIARKLDASPTEIARLVVQYESEPPPDRRFTSRVFQLRDAVDDIVSVTKRLNYIVNRYIRIGIARWFVVESVQGSATQLSVKGIFRFFRADADQINDDLTLRAEEDSAPARLRMTKNDPAIQVDAKGERESKALILAFQDASGLRVQEDLRLGGNPIEGKLMAWDPWSVFLVDLLNARFRSTSIEILNLTHAGFQTEQAGSDEANRPSIRAVRLEGRHLLDSRPACELLTQGQGLAELGITVRFAASATEHFALPLTVKVRKDHVVVLTGFGIADPAVAKALHSEVIAGVSSSLRHGLADEMSLIRLANEVNKRANAEHAPDKPTMFAPPEDAE